MQRGLLREFFGLAVLGWRCSLSVSEGWLLSVAPLSNWESAVRIGFAINGSNNFENPIVKNQCYLSKSPQLLITTHRRVVGVGATKKKRGIAKTPLSPAK